MASITREDRTSVQFVIPTAVDDALEELVKAENKPGQNRVFKSDIVRKALEEYLARRGIVVDTDVDRGGDRRQPKP